MPTFNPRDNAGPDLLEMGESSGVLLTRDPYTGRTVKITYDRTAGHAARNAALAKVAELRQQLWTKHTLRLGREPTRQEIFAGKLEVPDSRTPSERMADESWSPTPRTQATKYSSAIAAAEKVVRDEAFSKLTEAERRLAMLKEAEQREAGEQVEKDNLAAHLAANAARIEQAELMLAAENWSPNSDEARRALLRKLVASLKEPKADPRSTAELEKHVDAMKRADLQAAAEAAELKARHAAEAAEMAQAELAQYSELSKPEPVKAVVPAGATREERVRAFYSSAAATDEAVDHLEKAWEGGVSAYDAALSQYVIEE